MRHCCIELRNVIARLAEHDDPDQVRAIIGDAPERVVDAVHDLVQRRLGARIVDCEASYVSVGITLTLALADARRCVLKLVRPSSTLAPAVAVQAELVDRGLPFAPVLVPPTRCGAAFGYLMAPLDPGETVAYDPDVRGLLAESLARLVTVAADLEVPRALVRSQRRRAKLWGRPHSAIFDFESTTAGAESIDAVASVARDHLATTASPALLVHDDWSLQNVGIRDGSLCAIFDGDSIVATAEPIAVAHAAAFHAQDWRGNADTTKAWFYLGVDETLDFVGIYAAARRRPWTKAERATIEAALIYRLAYQARGEHALHPETHGPARRRLERFATAFGYRG